MFPNRRLQFRPIKGSSVSADLVGASFKDVKRLCGQKLNHHNVSCHWLSGLYGSHTSRMVNCDHGLYCSFAHPQWGHILQRPKMWWISGGSRPFCPAPLQIFPVIYAFISSLIGSGFGSITFLLHTQVYLRNAYLHAHDDRRVWIAAERRLALAWGK